VEYFRGIRNPIGIKVGPGMTREWLADLLSVLNPEREAGRIVLIHRLGETRIEDHLPRLISAVKESGSPILWVCDPMHGNTESTKAGIKTRRFRKIMKEVDLAFDIHAGNGSRLGGVHLELTGEDVTECTGGARDLSEEDLSRAYKSTVDPRLNYEQSLELAMLIVRKNAQVSR
jgi:3-deoxy-7-phosphoheptulonate synthase